MLQGAVLVLAQEAAEPAHAVAAHDVVDVDALIEIRDAGNMAAHHQNRLGLVLADQGAHLLDLAGIGHDAGQADDVVGVFA